MAHFTAIVINILMVLPYFSVAAKDPKIGQTKMVPCSSLLHNKILPSVTSNNSSSLSEKFQTSPFMEELCPKESSCFALSSACLNCKCPSGCTYGKPSEAECSVPPQIECRGERTFKRAFKCQYCFQTVLTRSEEEDEERDYVCDVNYKCDSVVYPRDDYTTNCTVNKEVLCLGRREFLKRRYCDWTGGYSWKTALAFSITLGGFGADKFYLGRWQEGIGKLFSFGGLGIWTLIDVVLVAVRYVGPADGSLYMN